MEILSEDAVKILERFSNFCDVTESDLNNYFNILKELNSVVLKIDPQKLLLLHSQYAQVYLKILRMKVNISAKKMLLEKEYEDWYAATYLDAVKFLEDNKKEASGRLLKDHIESFIKRNYYETRQKYLNTIHELEIQEMYLADVLKLMQNFNRILQSLSDLKEIWKPFLDIDKDEYNNINKNNLK